MRVLADENIEAASVAWLREIGQDVVCAAEDFPSAPDAEVLAIALDTNRILLTRDLDFGEIVFAEQRSTNGVVLLRLEAKNQWERLPVLQYWWPDIEQNAEGHFLVVFNQRLRIRKLRPLT